MKLLKCMIIGLTLGLSGVALAKDTCEADCADVVKQCSDTCKKALKKDNPDKINFCQDKCKEFENECRKECKAEKK